MIFTIILFLLIIVLLLKKLKLKNENSFSKIIGGPINLPIIGSLYLFYFNRDHLDAIFDKLYKKYGDFYFMKFGIHNCIVLNSPKLIREAFVDQSDFTHFRFIFKSAKFMGDEIDTAITTNSEFWKVSRQMIMTSVSKNKIGHLDQLYHLQYLKFENHIKKLIKLNNMINFEQFYMRLTFSIMYSTMFNFDLDFESETANEIIGIINYLFKQVPKLSDLLPIPEYLTNYDHLIKSVNDAIKVINPHVDKVLKRYNKDNNSKPSCALDHIIKSIEEQDEPKLIKNESLSHIVLGLFAAGIETTARSLEWMTIVMANNQNCQDQLYDELKSMNIRYPLLSDRLKYPYLNASIKELLRYKPVNSVLPPHENQESIQIQGIHIPKNTMIIATNCSYTKDSKYYKNPLKFNPNRFIGGNSEPPVLSFGVGPRSCPFQNFASDEFFIILTRLFQTFKFETPIPNKPICEETTLKISLQPLYKTYVKVQLRDNENQHTE